jgi:ribonuclease HI
MKYELYTDGGCRGNGIKDNPAAGLGCYLEGENIEPIYYKEQLNFKPNTNNKAEIMAVIRGLELIEKNIEIENDFIKNELIIYTDSAYTMNGITSWIKSWKANGWLTSKKEPVKNQELWIELDKKIEEAKEKFEIEFKKVKGHNGNRGNEIVDRLANEAMEGL